MPRTSELDVVAIERFDEAVAGHEDTVLGGILADPEIVKKLHCDERDFVRPKYKQIFRFIADRVNRGLPIGDTYVSIRAAGLLDELHDRSWFREITRDLNLISDAQTVGASGLLREARMWRDVDEAYLANRNNAYGCTTDFFDALDSIRRLEPTTGDIDDRKSFWEARGYAPPVGVKAFLSNDLRVDYLIDKCMAKNSPLVVAGASKAMKTTVSLYTAICLAAGQPFFGRFRTQQTRVLFASAESGAAVLQRNVRGMARMMELDLDELCESGQLSFQFWVPKVANEDMLAYFGDCIDSVQPGVVVLDPLYLSLDGDSQANLSQNGEQIHSLVRTILDRGCTPIVDDHVKRSSGNAKEYRPLQLEDITGAAKSEYFRQWMLLGRRSRLDDTEDTNSRRHDLWLTIGGSAGHSATWGLDIEETFDDHFESVTYTMDLRPASDIREEAKNEQAATFESRAELKAKASEQRAELLEGKLQRKADHLIDHVYKGDNFKSLTQNDIADLLGLKTPEARRVITILIDAKRLQVSPMSVVKNGRKYDGYVLFGSLRSGTWTG